jgi:hypothetical protein
MGKKGQNGLTKGARLPELNRTGTYVVIFLETQGSSPAVLGKWAALGCGVEDEELDDGVAEKVEGLLLLLRRVPAEAR